MSDRQKIKLLNLGEFYKGTGISRGDAISGPLPAVRYGELYTNYDVFIIGETRSKISQKVANEAFELLYGDILFAGSGETPEDIGKSAVFLLEKGYAGSDVIVFRPNNSKVSPKYLALYFETDYWKRQRKKAAQGHSIVHIRVQDLKRMTVKLPDLETQQKIVRILEICDHIIKDNEKLLEQEKNKNKWLINRLIRNNKNVKTEKLCNLAEIATGKKDVNQGCPDGKYPFFTCAKEHTWSNEYSFDGEAICIAGNGEIGKSFYFNGKFEAYQRTYVLTNFTVPGQYINYVIKSLFKEMVDHQKQMSAMPYIKLGTLKNFTVPTPDNEAINNIISILNNEERIIDTIQKEIVIRKHQKQYLLNHLINGDFDLTNVKLENKKEHK